jgi:DNA-binding transcriptional LysR family regulator
MLVKHLSYLTALARERHFGRAAEACNISQPALSTALRQLEAELGVQIVERAQRFKGFTPEGQLVLDWAQRLVHDFDGLRQDLTVLKRALAGRIRFGVIPAALPTVSLLTGPFWQQHPAVTLHVISLSSKEIQRGLDSFDLDLGFTYLDNEPLSRVKVLPLYRERFVFISVRDSEAGRRHASRRTITWHDAAKENLCLLWPDMQNRRIIDRIFESVGEKPKPVIETNSLLTLISHVKLGGWSSIVPHSLLLLLGDLADVVVLSLVDPRPSHSVGLVYADREPIPGLVRTFLASARRQKLQQRIDAGWKMAVEPGGDRPEE